MESFQVSCFLFDFNKKKYFKIVFVDKLGHVLKLPYEGKRLSMYIVAPTLESNTNKLFESLVNSEIEGFDHLLESPTSTSLQMPKFKLEKDYKLKNHLSNMGLGSLFNPYSADLTGFNDLGQTLAIDDVVQKAFIEVNEEGTEAAAATSIIMRTSMNPKQKYFVLNRPFWFFIRDSDTGLNLFSGRVANPKT